MRTILFFLFLSFITTGGNKKDKQPAPVENTPQAKLGEGSIWHPEKKAQMWVDITEGRVFMYKPAEGMIHNIELESMVGTVVPAKGEFFAIAAQETGITGIREDGSTEILADFPPDAEENVRFNDGKCDPEGRLWIGTMHKQARQGAGKLYMLEDDSLHIKEPRVTISNGIVWDTDINVMYYIDTPEQCIYAYDYEPETGNISNRRVVVEIPEENGSPDGMAIDSKGKLWVGHWGGHGVYRWDPKNGELLQKIEVPAPNVTSCAFGGKDLKTLYITTAREGLSEDQLAEYPLSGSLFVKDVEIKGTKAFMFKQQQ
ncbi:MAG: SMP-30/gluconolactonase/LRE family protein [Marinilabiliaceae bacterium]